MRLSVRIALIFLFLGIILFALSLLFETQIISVIGLGLIFWGALFLIITPSKYVESNLLITSTLHAYITIDRMLKDINPKNEAYNIPACPQDVNLPEHLKGLRETVTFIPAKGSSGMVQPTEIDPTGDNFLFENAKELLVSIAKDKFLIENPKGLLIASPGIGLLDQIEQRRERYVAKNPPVELDVMLPSLLKGLYLTKDIEMTTNGNHVTLQITDSLYKNLYSQKYNLRSINFIGCPIVSAAACAIAESTGKPTQIQKIVSSPNGRTMIATIKIVSGMFEEETKSGWPAEKINLRRTELLEAIKVSIALIEFSFDALINLQKKPTNWTLLRKYSKNFNPNINFSLQTMPSLNLDFAAISSAINSQNLETTSKEAYRILKTVYEYFNGLNLEDDLKESVPNFQSAKAIILAYYTLNDLLLGKLVGDGENKKECLQLENALETLVKDTNSKINIEDLRFNIEKVSVENDFESVDNIRRAFKEQSILNAFFNDLNPQDRIDYK